MNDIEFSVWRINKMLIRKFIKNFEKMIERMKKKSSKVSDRHDDNHHKKEARIIRRPLRIEIPKLFLI